jgi:hypothetical protein
MTRERATRQAPEAIVWIDGRHAIVASAAADGGVATRWVDRGAESETEFLAHVVHQIGDRPTVSIVGRAGDVAERRVLWGHVHVIDRIPVQNRFLTFGGNLRAAAVDDCLSVLDLRSPAPIVLWGGHSQATDPLAAAVGAFFGRLMVPVDYVPGVAEKVDGLPPEVLYRAFLLDALARSRWTLRSDIQPSPFDTWLLAAWARARVDPQTCTAAEDLLAELRLA